MISRTPHFALTLIAALGLLACGSREEGGAGTGGLVAVASRAPAFSAPDQTGEVRSLSDFRGGAVVLYFYPRDATPGCTAEACAFRDAWDRIEAAGATVVGVSTDDVASHAAFAAEHELSFPLLADTEGEIAEAYGVPSRFGFVSRVTFIIDGSGVVRRVFRDVDPAVHADEVVTVLESLADVSH